MFEEDDQADNWKDDHSRKLWPFDKDSQSFFPEVQNFNENYKLLITAHKVT